MSASKAILLILVTSIGLVGGCTFGGLAGSLLFGLPLFSMLLAAVFGLVGATLTPYIVAKRVEPSK